MSKDKQISLWTLKFAGLSPLASLWTYCVFPNSGLAHVSGLLLLSLLMSCVKHGGVMEANVPPPP